LAGVTVRRATLWIFLFAALAAGGGGLLSCGEAPERDSPGERSGRLEGRVTKIVDGDTIHVQVGGRREKVRYIGVDTPETVKPGEPVQCFGKAASDFNRRLVAGRRVRLVLGRERRDRYGRLLAYVRLQSGPLVEDELLRGGYARTLTIPPNDDRARHFAAVERKARGERRGLWGACPVGAG
jgi:micrococcal nuclease